MFDLKLLEPDRPRLFTRAEFMQMGELGLLDDDERVELLRGIIVAMSPPNPPHDNTIERLNMLLVPRVLGKASVRVQSAFAASDYSQPQPDLAVVPAERDFQDHPKAALLLIEVADSSLRKDRLLKSNIYAEAGVPEYWVVNVRERVVERYLDPTPDGYRSRTTVGPGGVLALLVLPDVQLAVDDFLG